MKEIVFHFNDGGYYIVRPDNTGDSICGSQAHKIMFALNKYHNYAPSLSFEARCRFILDRSKEILNEKNNQETIRI